MSTTIRIVIAIVLVVSSTASLAFSLNNVTVAEKNMGYEYGRCVFYEQISVEKCNAYSKGKGFDLYEKYYGDGSWTLEADPMT